MNEIHFKLSMLHGFAIIEEPCTVIIKTNTNTGKLYTADGFNRWLINLKAVTKDNLEILKNIDKSTINYTYSEISHLLLTGAIWENQVSKDIKLPVKGESVIATFDYVNKILLCTNITLIPRKSPKVFKASSVISNIMEEFNTLIQDINDE
jgi:hypothetical protein